MEDDIEFCIISNENSQKINSFLIEKLRNFVKLNPESVLGLDLYKISLPCLLKDLQKILEIIQIYSSHLIFESLICAKPFYLSKLSANILNYDFFSLNTKNTNFIEDFKKILKLSIKNICFEEKKSIIFIEIAETVSEMNHSLWDYLSILIEGMNFNILFDKKEINEILEMLNEYKEIESMKLDHIIYKISKLLANSIKFIISYQKSNNGLKEKLNFYPDFIKKKFIRFSFSENKINDKEIKKIEDILKLQVSKKTIEKIEYCKRVEMLLSPHFEDFSNYNLLKTIDFYAVWCEIISSEINKTICEKYEHLKTSTLYGRMMDYMKKNIEKFQNQRNNIENSIENTKKEMEKQEKEFQDNLVNSDNFSNLLIGKILKN